MSVCVLFQSPRHSCALWTNPNFLTMRINFSIGIHYVYVHVFKYGYAGCVCGFCLYEWVGARQLKQQTIYSTYGECADVLVFFKKACLTKSGSLDLLVMCDDCGELKTPSTHVFRQCSPLDCGGLS